MYRITIVRIETVTYMDKTNWVKMTDNEDAKPQYGYAPPVERTKEETREIYTQTVQQLDVKYVIAAVNEEAPCSAAK